MFNFQNIVVTKAVYKIMEHIDFLFANDSYPESWNQLKVEHFQNIVSRLTGEKKCVSSKYIYCYRLLKMNL